MRRFIDERFGERLRNVRAELPFSERERLRSVAIAPPPG